MPGTMAEMSPGQSGQVVSISGSDEVTTRLLEMGLTPGVQVTFVGTALLGDPLEIQVRGYRLSLRKADAAKILIESESKSST